MTPSMVPSTTAMYHVRASIPPMTAAPIAMPMSICPSTIPIPVRCAKSSIASRKQRRHEKASQDSPARDLGRPVHPLLAAQVDGAETAARMPDRHVENCGDAEREDQLVVEEGLPHLLLGGGEEYLALVHGAVAGRDLVERLAAADGISVLVARVDALEGPCGLDVAQDREEAPADRLSGDALDGAICRPGVGSPGCKSDDLGDIGNRQLASGSRHSYPLQANQLRVATGAAAPAGIGGCWMRSGSRPLA